MSDNGESNILKLARSQERVSNAELLTEDSTALAFTDRYRDLLLFDHDIGKWFVWTGTRRLCERTCLAFSWARDLARQLAEKAPPKVQLIASKAAFAGNVERYARADRAFAVTSDIWDSDGYLLGTPAGIVDLHTGELREAQPDDFITKATAVAPAETADCPRWMQFLYEATNGDQALIDFLQQFCGYSLTGDTKEHALLFICGGGGNGKSVFQNTVAGIFNDYAATAAMDTFTASNNGHPTDLAMLRGARMVRASETEESRAWAEARIIAEAMTWTVDKAQRMTPISRAAASSRRMPFRSSRTTAIGERQEDKNCKPRCKLPVDVNRVYKNDIDIIE